MQIKGGVASKGEARIDNQGRLLVNMTGAGTPYRAFARHIASASSPVAMTINAAPQDFSLPDLMGEFGDAVGTYSAPEFTITEAGTYRIELVVHWEATVDTPVAPDAQVLCARDDGGGYATLFTIPCGASDENLARAQGFNFFVLDLAVGDTLKLQEHVLNAPTLNLTACVWSIQKVA